MVNHHSGQVSIIITKGTPGIFGARSRSAPLPTQSAIHSGGRGRLDVEAEKIISVERIATGLQEQSLIRAPLPAGKNTVRRSVTTLFYMRAQETLGEDTGTRSRGEGEQRKHHYI